MAKELLKFDLSGEISPNLVTLLMCCKMKKVQKWIRGVKNFSKDTTKTIANKWHLSTSAFVLLQILEPWVIV